ncbi:hypothetical protein PACTADRAFT_51296 [Pachysolen tannophilus NRRL Y-2460]|uniref:Uncharacterized protein n=1 Tax=Pachysolen tannophilus NRRL Y-2460 TaxID=669874 RepID=A0A1E4TRU0_PACTA|nr:hypothetical protein PACTADRAFT_51296 [Pachysolen tannophilus NRRL Y-2460]
MPAIVDGIKKRKLDNGSGSAVKGKRASKIFSPFRAIGAVTNEIPFAVGSLGNSFYIVTSVGSSFQIYDANTLNLLFVSKKQTPGKINYITAHFHYVYCCWDNCVGIYKRGNLEHLINVDTNEKLIKLLIFGDYLICSTKNEVFIYKKNLDSDKKFFVTEFYSSFKIAFDEIIDIVHPPTYLNKIVIATQTNLIIYNVKTVKLIFTSEIFANSLTTLEVAPVLDIVAIGFNNGEIFFYNLRKGKIFKKISTGINSSKITSLSFRTDGSQHLVASFSNGDLFFYDLDNKSRLHLLRNAHKEIYGGVSKVAFLNNQPVLITNGGDNHLKEYCFDPSLSSSNSSIVSPPRHLRSRGGHSAPISTLIFDDDEKSHFIFSASKDRSFWKFSLRKDAQSQELSQRAQKQKNLDNSTNDKRIAGQTLKEKFPEIICMAESKSREGDWENVITGHKDEAFARTWDSRNNRVGRWQLKTIDNGNVKSCCISHCGNFGLVGSSNGGIGVYNLQSGLLRREYKLHKRPVTGIAIDGMNRKMVSCALDGIVGFYDFTNSKFLGKLQLSSSITQMVYHKSSDLVALALDDLSIVVVDVITQKPIRVFVGHTNRITSFGFSNDGRWLFSASLDSTVRTWDLPTGGCIDGFKVPSVVTNLKMSPNGEYLATSHVNSNGINLWTNRSQFKAVSLRHIDDDTLFQQIALPNASGDGGSSILDGAFDDNEEGENKDGDHINQYETLDQINSELVTLSLEPRSKFNTLLHIDTIRKRNKPKEAPKKPENAPFFLSLGGDAVGDRASIAEKNGQGNDDSVDIEDKFESSRLAALRPNDAKISFESEFTQELRLASKNNNYDVFLQKLVNFPPAIIDLEIKSLDSLAPYKELISFVQALTVALKSNKNYELVQVLMSIFLKNHGDVIYNLKTNNNNNSDQEAITTNTPSTILLKSLEEWETLNNENNGKIEDLVKYCSGVVNFFSVN